MVLSSVCYDGKFMTSVVKGLLKYFIYIVWVNEWICFNFINNYVLLDFYYII